MGKADVIGDGRGAREPSVRVYELNRKLTRAATAGGLSALSAAAATFAVFAKEHILKVFYDELHAGFPASLRPCPVDASALRGYCHQA
jgi:hypothetical protein